MTTGPVLFHIGLPKTGTTSLQETLRGWPNTAAKPFDRPGGLDGRRVQEAAVAGTLTGTDLDRHLAASRTDPDLPVVFSAEALAGTPREWFLPLASPAEMAAQVAATGWDARVLVTLRQPRPWLRSNHRFFVRGGYAETYDRFLTRTVADIDAGRGMASWDVTVAAYDAAFGADAVAVVWFEDLIRDAAAVWRGVAARLDLPGLDRLGAVPLPRHNDAAVGHPALELTLNRRLLATELRPRPRPRPLRRPVWNRRIAPRLVRRSSEAWFTDRTTTAEPAVVDRLATMAEDLVRAHGAAVPAGLDLRA
ncbi:MAG TPA: sulfotransferase [Iamia sp.]